LAAAGMIAIYCGITKGISLFLCQLPGFRGVIANKFDTAEAFCVIILLKTMENTFVLWKKIAIADIKVARSVVSRPQIPMLQITVDKNYDSGNSLNFFIAE
jgi:hypothetical protein